jgi:predicted dehydrogenase
VVLRAVLLGAGAAGARHARALAGLADRCALVGVHDPDEHAAARCALSLDVPAIEALEDALHAAEVAVVAGDVAGRVPLASAALTAGLDVLLEPPLAHGVADSRRLLSAIVRAPRRPVAMVADELRYDPAVRALREWLAGQTPLWIDCEHTRAVAPGPAPHEPLNVVDELMIGDLQLLLSLVDSPVTAIQATGRHPRAGAPIDHAAALLTLDDDVTLRLVASRAGGPGVRRLTVGTADARVVADLDARVLEVSRTRRGPSGETIVEPTRVPVDDDADPVVLQAEAFLHCVEHRTPPKMAVGGAIAAQEAAEAIVKRIELVHRRASASPASSAGR